MSKHPIILFSGVCICGAPYSGNFRCVNPTTGSYCGGGGYGARADVGYSTAGQDVAAAAALGIGIRSTNCGLNLVIYYTT